MLGSEEVPIVLNLHIQQLRRTQPATLAAALLVVDLKLFEKLAGYNGRVIDLSDLASMTNLTPFVDGYIAEQDGKACCSDWNRYPARMLEHLSAVNLVKGRTADKYVNSSVK